MTREIIQHKYVILDRGRLTKYQCDSEEGAQSIIDTLSQQEGLPPGNTRFSYDINVRYQPEEVHPDDRF